MEMNCTDCAAVICTPPPPAGSSRAGAGTGGLTNQNQAKANRKPQTDKRDPNNNKKGEHKEATT
jgi:hypothetical protein